jgi:hypothetical protein
MLPSTELGHQKTEHRTGGSQGRTKTEQLYVRDSSAVAVVGDQPCANRNKDGVWRFDTLGRSPSAYCSSPTSRYRRNSNVFSVPRKTARRATG